jgi:hypothetical protein
VFKQEQEALGLRFGNCDCQFPIACDETKNWNRNGKQGPTGTPFSLSPCSPSQISLLIADHPVFRRGLRMIIQSDQQLGIVAEADMAKRRLN